MAVGAEVGVIIAEGVETAKAKIKEGSVEVTLTASNLVEKRFQMMRQLFDRAETHHRGRSLDAVNQPERLAQRLLVARLLFQFQQHLVEAGDLLVGLIEIKGHQVREIEPRRHRPTSPARKGKPRSDSRRQAGFW